LPGTKKKKSVREKVPSERRGGLKGGKKTSSQGKKESCRAKECNETVFREKTAMKTLHRGEKRIRKRGKESKPKA